MRSSLTLISIVFALVFAAACGDDTGSEDLCVTGCQRTVEAACSNGPTTQQDCETTCRALEAGACGADYGALQSCAQGQAVTCSQDGLPIIEACANEQAAFIACLN